MSRLRALRSGLHAHLRAVTAHNLATLRRQPLAELSGSLGDLGTLLPLLLSLTLTASISLPSTLLVTGLANIGTGLAFGVPLPVQPMKALAAAAIERRYSPEATAASGLLVAGAVGALAATGLLERGARVVPVPVVKGIQAGAGLSLIVSAGGAMLRGDEMGWTSPGWADNWLWALAAALALLACAHRPRAPYALVVVVLGFVLAGIRLGSGHASTPQGIAPLSRSIHTHIPIVIPSGRTFLHPALSTALGQLPLTLLNSVVAVAHLAGDLLSADHPTPSNTAIALSVAAMNLIGCWFGAMPACHGSGGLAAQWRFGARSGASIVLLGLAKLVLAGVVLGVGGTGGTDGGVVGLLARFPRSLLGIMVVAAGVELAAVGVAVNEGARDLWEAAGERQQRAGEDARGDNELAESRKHRTLSERERKDRWSVMLVTVAGLLAFKNDGVGFVSGMAWHYGLVAPERWLERRSHNPNGSIWSRWRRSGSAEERQGLLGVAEGRAARPAEQR